MVREISLESVGLMSVADAAAVLKASVRSVQKWISDGLIPVVVAGGGMRTVYLLRGADVREFTAPPRGRPVGSKDGTPRARRKRGDKK